MPECQHTTTVHAPLAPTWAFVREMDNWAPLLTGYQGHEKRDDKVSVWRLRGDVGMLSREVELEVEITQWVDGELVDFTLKGLNEQVDGGGTFQIRELADPSDAVTQPPAAEPAPPAGLFARLFGWLARLLFRVQHGEEKALQAPAAQKVELSFRLEMNAGGPMAPMINAMLQPALLPATEDLATKIANRVLQEHSGGAADITEAAEVPA